MKVKHLISLLDCAAKVSVMFPNCCLPLIRLGRSSAGAKSDESGINARGSQGACGSTAEMFVPRRLQVQRSCEESRFARSRRGLFSYFRLLISLFNSSGNCVVS